MGSVKEVETGGSEYVLVLIDPRGGLGFVHYHHHGLLYADLGFDLV